MIACPNVLKTALIAAACLLLPPCRAADFSALERLDVAAARADVGIGVLDPQTGARWFRQPDRRFPMQSVYKLPIAIAVLERVRQGALDLDAEVILRPEDVSPHWSPIRDKLAGGVIRTSVRELIEYAVGQSCNTSADALTATLGGPRAVSAVLETLGIRGVRVDRTERQLQNESVGLPLEPVPADEAAYKRARAAVPAREQRRALQRYLRDPRDTATPRAMVEMLARLARGELLPPEPTAFLLRVMTASPTGQQRLKAGLPPGWTVAHKTGTGADVLGRNTATNDVGIVTAPDGRRLVVAVFLAGSRLPPEARERFIARVAQAAVTALR